VNQESEWLVCVTDTQILVTETRYKEEDEKLIDMMGETNSDKKLGKIDLV